MSWEETINNRRDMALSIIRRGSTFGYCDGCPFLSPYPSAAKCELLDERRSVFQDPFCRVTDFTRYILERL